MTMIALRAATGVLLVDQLRNAVAQAELAFPT